jgi:hypothetical protein
VLDSPEIAVLVSELEMTRWTRRRGYPLRSMVGMALAKSIYAVPTRTRTVALVREHAALRTAIVGGIGDVPSVYACDRFTDNGPERETFSDPDASWGHRSAVSTRKGRRVLRLQDRHGRLHRHRPSHRVECPQRPRRPSRSMRSC